MIHGHHWWDPGFSSLIHPGELDTMTYALSRDLAGDRTAATADVHTDTVMPSLDTLRHLSSISETVSQLNLMRAKPGMRSKVGINQLDTTLIQTAPQFRWLNEGYHAPSGKKRVAYYNLSLPKWVVGQLSNIFHMKDSVAAKHALHKVIPAMKDATSLPCIGVRSSWATSMHALEEGNLQNTQPPQLKKICKYFNEGVCSHELNNG